MRVKLNCQQLETRSTPSVTAVAPGDGNVYVTGTPANDVITVSIGFGDTPKVVVKSGFATVGTFTLGSGADNRVVVYGGDGNDVVRINGTRGTEIHGGAGNDTLTGGNGGDVIWGDDGNDLVDAGSGNDVVIGGFGQDQITGGSGDDIIVAGDLNPAFLYNGTQAYDYTTFRMISDDWSAGPGGFDGTQSAVALPFYNDIVNGMETDTSPHQNRLTGSTGQDWFVCDAGDVVTDSTLSPNYRQNV